jgi:glutathione synthase/RimK-type ligase-like ATP-grasp enzyme
VENRGSVEVALVTCAELPDLDPDDRLLIEPLTAAGVGVHAVVWDDPDANWARYDLVVLRSTWDYPRRRDEFVAWAESVRRLANPADVVAWNTDKRYLAELAARGVPVVPTRWIDPDRAWTPPEGGEWVVKPAISAGSKDTGRYDTADAEHRRLVAEHVSRLQAAGRTVMVQPYLHGIDTAGETALMFLDGSFSHAVRKGPMLTGPDVGVKGLYKEERIMPREPSAAELAVARAAVAEVPGGSGRILYARVDVIPGPDGAPLIVELELAEPSLFLGTAPGAVQRLADAILRRLIT